MGALRLDHPLLVAETTSETSRCRQRLATDPKLLQEDPEPGKKILPISIFNRHVYVGNNPINRDDPSGMDWWDGFKNTFFGVLGGVAAVLTVGALIGGMTIGEAVLGSLLAVTSATIGAGAIAAAGAAGISLATGNWGSFWTNASKIFEWTFGVSMAVLGLQGGISMFDGGLSQVGGNGILGYAGTGSATSGSGYSWVTIGGASAGTGPIPLAHEATHTLLNVGYHLIGGSAAGRFDNGNVNAAMMWGGALYGITGFLGSPLFYGTKGLGKGFFLEPN